ncbi:hypothetical protein HYN69_02855 [Gemmobacter aquarius]|uniref:Gamma-glutamylcyclotransferase AIG2-like domain-containing protein n=1 Tax=Paragemmobacter aquarius TaxID=2169400 RepID=A0A2S0UIH3_9RHOB|nr:gamma-glutamylcyclotransferase [Gemmobacter aquarius]AWB47585.1 hypothetical protein HYN69_02855 [Gemmobacter aquarius]
MSDVLTYFQSLPYFAYGSNLNAKDWEKWCDDNRHACGPLEPVGGATAHDHRLVFGKHSAGRQGGVADIRPAVGHAVEGVLFELTEAQRAALAAKEGAKALSAHYEAFALIVEDAGGNQVQAFSYRVTATRARDHVGPHTDYVNVVASGLSDHGLSSLALWEAAGACGLTPSSVAGIFVYGTLLSGQSRAALVQADAVRHPAAAKGRLVDCGAYPAYVPGPRGDIQGEFIAVADIGRTIEDLDRIEGYAPHRTVDENLFQRRLITLAGPNGARVTAWTYIFSGRTEHLPVIQSGDWRFHQGLGRAEAPRFKQSSPATLGSHDWVMTELRRLRWLAMTRPDTLTHISTLTYGAGVFWSGGELLLIAPDFHGDLCNCRDEVVMTRHAASFTGLFVLCQTIFAQTPVADSWRAAYSRMSGPIRMGQGSFADQAVAALDLAEEFAVDLASATSMEDAQ